MKRYQVTIHVIYRHEYTIEAESEWHAEQSAMIRAEDAAPDCLAHFDAVETPEFHAVEVAGETEEL